MTVTSSIRRRRCSDADSTYDIKKPDVVELKKEVSGSSSVAAMKSK